MINAMTYLYLLLAIALLLALASVLLVRRDGRGPARPPRSHHDDLFVPSHWPLLR